MVIISVFSFVVIFGLMVFAHEFGHFVVAKKAGVHVREFGFGFPLGPDKPPSKRPLTWKVAADKSGTTYTINLIPFGGFVNLGENDPDDPRSLGNFSKRIRLAALVAGPAMNIVLAFIIFVLAAMVGYPEFLLGVGIIEVSEGSPAEKAGLQANDIVLRVGDLELDHFLADLEQTETEMVGEMVEYTAARAGQSITVLVQRGLGQEARRLEFTVIPYADENGEGKMGIVISAVPVRLQRVNASLFDSLKYGAEEISYTIQMTILIPIQVIRGLLPAYLARSVGPVGIAKLTGDAVQQSIDVGWAFPILQLTGILNVAIAITNLLPLPALDGGRILFVLLEAIRGKPLSPRKEGLAHSIGLVLLLLFFVAVTIQDIFVPLPQGFSWVDYLY